MTALSGPSLSASFVYDGLGRRTSKTVNSATTGYWYDGDDVLAELSGSTPTATYVRSLAIDEPFIRKGGSDEFYQTDALGSALALTDSVGASQTTYTHEPFGKTTITGTSSNPFQYTGRENDGTSLYYYRARYYSPTLQRFILEDPIEFFAGDVNLYLHVKNRPTVFTDPTGEIVPLALIGAGAIVGAGINVGGTLIAAYLEDKPIDSGALINAAVAGAIAGGVGAIVGPVGGTVAKAIGQSSVSLLAKGITSLVSGAGGALGQYAGNLVTGRKDSVLHAAIFAAGGGAVASFIPTQVANTLLQASYFSPNFNTLLLLRSPQSALITGGIALSNILGAGSNF